jgi:hypothetical protein
MTTPLRSQYVTSSTPDLVKNADADVVGGVSLANVPRGTGTIVDLASNSPLLAENRTAGVPLTDDHLQSQALRLPTLTHVTTTKAHGARGLALLHGEPEAILCRTSALTNQVPWPWS